MFARRIVTYFRQYLSDPPQPPPPPFETSSLPAAVLRCRIAYNEFGGYCIPESSIHRPATQKIVEGQVWEPDTIAFMRTQCGDRDIVHAGTYFGDFLPALSAGLAANAIVWAFEPHPENYRCADITVKLNALTNVVLTSSGLGATPGTVPMKIADVEGLPMGGGSRIARPRDTPDTGTFTEVTIVRLDDMVPPDRMIGVLQLDVEGYEQQALAGATRILRHCRPALILEHLPSDNWCTEHLWPLGYEITQHVHANTVLQARNV